MVYQPNELLKVAKRTTRIIAVVGLGLVLLLPGSSVAADRTTATFNFPRTGDLIPNEDRISIWVTPTIHTGWAMSTSPRDNGADATIEPLDADITGLVEYSLKPQCCPNQHREGSFSLQATIQPKCQDFPQQVSPYTIILRICATWSARPSYDRGSTTPSRIDWPDEFNAQPFSIAGQTGGTLNVETNLVLTAQGVVEGPIQTWQGAVYDLRGVDGSPALSTTVQFATPTSTAPPPETQAPTTAAPASQASTGPTTAWNQGENTPPSSVPATHAMGVIAAIAVVAIACVRIPKKRR